MSELKTVNLGSEGESKISSNDKTQGGQSRNENTTILEKLNSLIFNISVEPLMLLFIAPSVMGSLTTENLNLEKACRVNIGFDEEICNAMVVRNTSGYSAAQEIEVQKLVSTMLAYKTVIQGIVPFVLMLFLGSWSDRHGKRKPFILGPIIGELMSTFGFIICTYFFLELSVEYAIFFEAVPPSITGGWFCFFVGVYSYVGGKSSLETKTLKVGSATMMTHVAVTIGIALSGVTYRSIGFYGVYVLSIILFTCAIIFGFVIIKDDIPGDAVNQEKSKGESKKSFLADLFDLQHILNIMSICFKQGPNNRMQKICGIMVLVLVMVGPGRGELSVMYMFTRRKFAWDELSYSAFNTFHCITQMLGAAICLTVFVKWMKVDDAALGMIAMTSKIIGSVAYGLAPESMYFYLAAITELFNGSSHIALRSIMSKLVSVQELGQTNSLFGMCEALTPLVCGPLYSYVYNRTIAYFPGAFFLLSGLFHVVAFFIFLWIYSMHRTERKIRQRQSTAEIKLNNVENHMNIPEFNIVEKLTNISESKINEKQNISADTASHEKNHENILTNEEQHEKRETTLGKIVHEENDKEETVGAEKNIERVTSQYINEAYVPE